jgi:hypothetical protein
MTPADRKAPRPVGKLDGAGFRSLEERRVDPGTLQREVIDRPSLLAPAPPKGSVVGAIGKMRV